MLSETWGTVYVQSFFNMTVCKSSQVHMTLANMDEWHDNLVWKSTDCIHCRKIALEAMYIVLWISEGTKYTLELFWIYGRCLLLKLVICHFTYLITASNSTVLFWKDVPVSHILSPRIEIFLASVTRALRINRRMRLPFWDWAFAFEKWNCVKRGENQLFIGVVVIANNIEAA